jgi:hypothetical protein
MPPLPSTVASVMVRVSLAFSDTQPGIMKMIGMNTEAQEEQRYGPFLDGDGRELVVLAGLGIRCCYVTPAHL